ncbi:hypothetical protein H310_12527 [Aphanomyces invadans]|uniref:Glycosyl transferase family 1 domain-containing protein n=1 Tax=Aphanomyces invadans TaxID=157072 RepID=A0A024TIR1_9STRA|nr:hypothetical protein H310_12527 [Aphanomyces invadans]ETV93476.1 hypothetical protein H310_12527 [Aphanomyces invadans]|eukprot:XP_008877818.1 hypothetical protein H310_12527 [Aphanomyces invadans]
MAMTGLKVLSFRWILLGCIGALVVFQSVDVFLSYRAAASSAALATHRRAFRPLKAPDDNDLLHMNQLMTDCLTKGEAIISWRYMQPPLWRDSAAKDVLAEILRCPEAEVFLPVGIRSHGYCEDAMAYVKFLETRAMPYWVYEEAFHIDGKEYSYHDLCPHTAVILMNHYWDGLPDRHDFPKTKKLVLMPNVEMHDLKAAHYHRVDYVLAKTKDSYKRITNWYSQEGNNPRHTQVYFTMHTSSDPTVLTKEAARTDPVAFTPAERNWHNLTIFHANGHSTLKNTIEVLDCWASRPDLPPISIYSSDGGSNDTYWRLHREGNPLRHVDYHSGEFVSPPVYGKLLLETSVIMCPSIAEGFGHYINQARASGALVVTTDGAPMNEFIDESSGVLIQGVTSRGDVLMGTGTEFHVDHKHICATMDRVLALTPSERAARAAEGQRRYFEQMAYFRTAMKSFQKLLRWQLTPPRNDTSSTT